MIAVVGAGLAGVTAARALAAAGRAVLLLDKSPRVGGRMATKRVELPDGRSARFDHGCQYLAATTPAFAALLAELTAAGVLTDWPDAPAGLVSQAPGRPWHVAPGGMRSVVEHLAAGLPVQDSAKVVRATASAAGWTLGVADRRAVTCSWLVLTPPVPQSLELLFQSGVALPRDLLFRLREVEYDRALALCAVSEASPRPAPPAAVDWVADNAAKGVSGVGPAWTVLLNPRESEAAWDAPVERLAAAAFGAAPAGVQLHRWRYCRARNSYPQPCATVPDLRLTFAGDGFGRPGGTAEAAYLSGLAAAAATLESV